MKRLTLLFAVLMLAAQPVAAGGDKVRGEKGVGTVCQEQVDWHGYERRP